MFWYFWYQNTSISLLSTFQNLIKKQTKLKQNLFNGIVKERSRIVICFYCVFFTFVGFFGTDAKNSNKRVSKLVGQVKLVAAQAKWGQGSSAHRVLLEFRWRFCVWPGTWLNILRFMPKNFLIEGVSFFGSFDLKVR